SAEAAIPVGDTERGEARVGELPGRMDQLLEHLLDRPLGCDRQHRIGDGLECGAEGFGGAGYLLQRIASGCVIGPLWKVIVMLPVQWPLPHFGGLVIRE